MSSKIRLLDCLTDQKKRLQGRPFLKKLREKIKDSKSFSRDDCIDAFIYGIPCEQIIKGKGYQTMLHQIDTDPLVLTLTNIVEQKSVDVDLSNIVGVSFDSEALNEYRQATNLPTTLVKNYARLLINQTIYDFIFTEDDDFTVFLAGIINLFENEIIIDNIGFENKVQQYWKKYDVDFSGSLSEKEFENFMKELNFRMCKNKIKEEFQIVDLNKNGQIDYAEFLHFFKSYMNGHEYQKIFQMYDIDMKTQKHLGVIPYSTLRILFNEIQKEKLSEKELVEFIYTLKESTLPKHKKKLFEKYFEEGGEITDEFAKENLYLTSSEFMNYLHSPLANALDYVKMNTKQNMKRPLNDYYINSTHNTYIMGNQLTSYSSPEMYAVSMLEGNRLVELDCYNGEGDDVVITHGYTMVTDIHLKDILTKLRETAFATSPYPVLLSIENHCDEYHQGIMAKLFKEILKDLYILDQENPPDYFPSPEDLKGKFIIKCSGKRVLKDRTKITPRSQMNYEQKEDEMYFEINDEVTQETEMHGLMLKASRGKPILETSDDLEEIVKKNSEEMQKTTETYTALNAVRGIFGTKFKGDAIAETNYQPWEMVTLKAAKVIEFCSTYESRKKIVDFTENSFMKAYPQSFNSYNYDIVKCWIVGCQVAAINIQSTFDDFTLLNKIFFKMNGNLGYVLKPKKLLPESTEIEKYEKPKEKVTFELVSFIAIQNLLQKAGIDLDSKKKTLLEIEIIGSNEDTKNNKKYQTNIPPSYFHHNFSGEKFEFKVYENELSFFYFRLYHNKEIIGRSVIPMMMMKEGYRNIIFYDNNCVECFGSFILAKINK